MNPFQTFPSTISEKMHVELTVVLNEAAAVVKQPSFHKGHLKTRRSDDIGRKQFKRNLYTAYM
jgi:hypothetical protein